MSTSKKNILRFGLVTLVVALPLLAYADTATFVSLSKIPAFDKFTGPTTLPAFLNALYSICIGVAVVLAVLQLVRAGVTYSMSDAITSKEEAKHLMLVSVLGLVLVLSPVIVFGIINPKILKLNIDTSGIQADPSQDAAINKLLINNNPGTNYDNTAGIFTQGNTTYVRCDQDSCNTQGGQCVTGGGDPSHACRDSSTGEFTSAGIVSNYSCPQGSYNYVKCALPAAPGTPGTNNDNTSGTFTENGNTYTRCPESGCDGTQCAAGGGSALHACRDAATGQFTSTSLVSNYACPYGSYNYVECIP